MKKSIVLILFFLTFSLYSKAQNRFNLDSLIGTQAYNFEVKTINGKKYTLSKLKDKIVVLNFWYIGCAPCIREFPDLNKVVEKYKDNKNIIFLAISVDGVEEVVKKFVKRKEFKYQVVATDFTIAKKQGVKLYPTNIVIDKTGKITLASVGYRDTIETEISEAIEKNLKE